MTRHGQRRAGGFTLIELTIAAVVLLIALLGLMATMAYCARLDMDTEETTIALHGVRQRLEVLEATNYNNLPALNGTTYAIDTTNPLLDRLRPIPGRAKVITVNVAQKFPPNAMLLEVTVTAEWTGALGRRSLEMKSLIAAH